MVRLYIDKSNNMACNFYFISFPMHASYQVGFLQTSEIGRSFMWEQFCLIYFSFFIITSQKMHPFLQNPYFSKYDFFRFLDTSKSFLVCLFVLIGNALLKLFVLNLHAMMIQSQMLSDPSLIPLALFGTGEDLIFASDVSLAQFHLASSLFGVHERYQWEIVEWWFFKN